MLLNKKLFAVGIITAVFCTIGFCAQTPPAITTPHPFFQLKAALSSFRDSTNAYEEIDAKLDSIVPAECKVDETVITKDEMEFLILTWKLDFAVNLKKGKKAITTARQLEKIMEAKSLDYHKLSSLMDLGFDLDVVARFDIIMAYVITGNAEPMIAKIQDQLAKYPKDSPIYVMTRFSLGVAFLKSGEPRLAIPPMEYAYAAFIKDDNKSYAALAASNLTLAYAGIDDSKKSKEWQEKAMALAERTSSDTVKCEIALKKLLDMLDVSQWDMVSKKEFEENRAFVLSHSTSDLQIWATYIFSAFIKIVHGYSIDEILPDLEKAYMYREMIWEGIEVGNNLQELNHILDEAKDGALQQLAKEGNVEKVNFWNAKFEQIKHRENTAVAMASDEISREFLPLFVIVSKYKAAEQLLASELAKPEARQDKRLIQRVGKTKREIEIRLDAIKKQLSEADRAKLQGLLADNFVIHPDSLGQLSSVLPPGYACLQYLLVGENIIAYIVVKNAPPFIKTISLQEHGLNSKMFTKKLSKIRTLLQSNAPVPLLQKELTQLNAVLLPSDLVKSLEKLNVRKLVVNASGILRYIPIAALFDGQKYLVEKYQITNITGMDLIRLAKMNDQKHYENTSVAVFADPDGSLPQGRQEGEQIAKFFANRKLYVGDKASLDEFESMAGQVNFVHLATHAVLDPKYPGKSYIQFADGKKWYYYNMSGFNIHGVDSIVLSACSTAMGEKGDGSEIEGMAYQLLKKSPSGSILASFWSVDDSATAMLMSIYYKHVTDSIKAKNVLDRGGALHEAQLALLHNPDTSSPFYWAAFALFGDFR